jgi:hypothetical protein
MTFESIVARYRAALPDGAFMSTATGRMMTTPKSN